MTAVAITVTQENLGTTVNGDKIIWFTATADSGTVTAGALAFNLDELITIKAFAANVQTPLNTDDYAVSYKFAKTASSTTFSNQLTCTVYQAQLSATNTWAGVTSADGVVISGIAIGT